MSVPTFFLACFVVGFTLSLLSVLFRALGVHVHPHLHLPFGHHHPPMGAGQHHGPTGPINFATVTVFLAWFGGTGFLLTSQYSWLTLPALGVAVVAGLAGSAVVFWFMARVLWSPRENLQHADFHMVGVHGRLSSPIRDGGTGELIFSRAGSRHACNARSADGAAIERNTEVIVMDYQRGIAYVKRWDDLAHF